MAIETLHVRQSLVPDLSAHDLEEHLFHELLQDRYGSSSSRALTVEPTVTGEDESALVCPSTPGSSSSASRAPRATRSSSTSDLCIAEIGTASSPSSDAARTGCRRRWRSPRATTTGATRPAYTMVKILTPEWLCANLPAVASGLNQFLGPDLRPGTWRGRPCPTPMEVRPARILVAVAVAAAVGAASSAGGSTARSQASITVWLQTDAQNGWPELVASVNSQFQKEHPGVDVNVQYQTWATHPQKFDATLAGGNAPDVIEMGTTRR